MRLLELRILEGKPDAHVARFFGMPDGAYAVHLLRAARAFMEAYTPVWGRAERDVPLQVEENEGKELLSALASMGQAAPSVAGLSRALRHLGEHGPKVKARLEALAKEEAASPRAKRETLIRRVLVIILVAVTLYLYFSRPPI